MRSLVPNVPPRGPDFAAAQLETETRMSITRPAFPTWTMRRGRTSLGLTVLAGAILLSPVVARSAPVWEPAEEISGTTGAFGEVTGLSCVTDDDCVMVGYFDFSPGIAAVAEKVDGTWGPAQQNVGLASIPDWDTAVSTSATSVSCMPSGECVVAGSLGLTSGGTTGYVATRTNGSWSAVVIPGLAALSTDKASPTPNPFGTNLRVSCDATGRCAAGGQYTYGAPNNLFGAWVAHRDTNGTWSSAIDVPGVPDLNAADNANLTRLSCPGGGNCVAIGTYRATNIQAFIVELVDGVWGQAFPVDGLLPPGGLNQGAVSFEGLDCATFDDCAASGRYGAGGPLFGGFVVDKVGGTWGSAIAVPGLATANNVQLQHVSCPAVGACALTAANLTTNVAYLVNQVGGTWQTAEEMTFAPGLDAVINAMRGISCSGPGECIAVGRYRTSDFSTFQAWQAVQSGGVWAEADVIPGMADLLTDPPSRSHGDAVDCVVGAGCNVGGTTFFGGAPYRFFAAAHIDPPTPPVTTDPPTSPVAAPWIPTPQNEQPRVPGAQGEMQREGGQPVQLGAISSRAGEVAYVDEDGLLSVVLTGDTATSVARGLVATREGMVRCEVCGDMAPGSIVEIWAFSTPRLVAAAVVDERGCIDVMVPLSAPLDGGPTIGAGQHTLQVVLPLDDGQGRLAVNVGVSVGGLRPGSIPAGEGMPTGAAALVGLLGAALAMLVPALRRGRVQGATGSV